MTKPLLGRIAFALISLFTVAALAQSEKEWTVLVYLNGHNNLDSFGTLNVNQMTQVGSSDQVNIIVQWASESYGKTRRLYVKKGKFDVIEELAPVDMGDYHSLIDFAQWAKTRYPAKKYMVDVWNHGNGWHIQKSGGQMHANDISWDDISGNHITTEDLGLTLGEIAKITGHKVELYASDACLMAMPEVANEMSTSVNFFAGSEEVEPGEGWPYEQFLGKLIAKPNMDGGELAKILSKEYQTAYSGGVYGRKDVTFSAFDMSKMGMFNQAIRGLSTELKNMDATSLKSAFQSIGRTQSFSNDDYKDLGDYLKVLETDKVRVSPSTIASVRSAMSSFIIANNATSGFAKATGLSIWLPDTKSSYDTYSTRYMKLQFNKESGWGEFLSAAVRYAY